MAIPVFSTRFLNGHLVTSPPSYVVPAGYVAVLRDLDVVAPPTTGNSIVLVVATAVLWIAELGVEPAFSDLMWRGRAVVNSGEVVTFEATEAVDFQLSGYLLTAP